MVTIREEEIGDRQQIQSVHQHAFGQVEEADISS
jgi:hypothetical protein